MSILSGGGGGGDNSAMMQMLRDSESRANAEANRLAEQNKLKNAEVETQRVNRSRAGGAAAFTTNGYAGYSDRQLGGGSSITATA